MQRRPSDMDREDIKAAIRKSGITLNELSRRGGYSITAVRVALMRPWPAVEALIAKHLGSQPQLIWPSRYDPQGFPLHGHRTSRIIPRNDRARIVKRRA